MPRPPWREWTWRDWLREVGTQCWQQPLHAGLTLVAARQATTGDPWAIASTLVIVVLIVLKERKEYPSKRPWEPWIDFVGYAVGIGLGVWLGLR